MRTGLSKGASKFSGALELGGQRLALAFCLLVGAGSCAEHAQHDLIIKNARVIDGTGSSQFNADIAISGDRIAKIGAVEGTAHRVIDAEGKFVSPGWIDMMDQSEGVLLKNGLAENKLMMGITSAIGGEGGVPVPAGEIRDYFSRLESQGISLNFGVYYNVFQARQATVGDKDIVITPEHISAMQDLVRLAMEEGVVGISSAAFYPPHSFMSTNELVALGQALAPYGGMYAAHIRDESRLLIPAIKEMITIAKGADIAVEIFHLKNAFYPNWGEGAYEVIELINDARSEGVDIAANQYPYIAGATSISATIPTWVFKEGEQNATSLLRDPDVRKRLKEEIEDPNSDRLLVSAGGWQNIVLINAHNKTYEKFYGQSFDIIAAKLGKEPADAAWDIMLEALPNTAVALYFLMSEDDVRAFMKQPWVSFGSDAASAQVLGEADALGIPHPRSYGTFPRIISKYVRETETLRLEDAIRKMTSFPANRMKLKDRGQLKEGFFADLVIFDYETISDHATWEAPFETSSGIDYVLVNGEIVVDNGRHTGIKPGKVLYGPGHRTVH